jgi:hypothetical protein
MYNIDEVTDKRLQALRGIEKDKIRVVKAYNKKVKLKSFQVGDLIWKMIMPISAKDHKFGKRSPSWEGSYNIVKVIIGNSYLVETLWGERLHRALNGRYLNKYYPTVWQEASLVSADVLPLPLQNKTVDVLPLTLVILYRNVFSMQPLGKTRGAYDDD